MDDNKNTNPTEIEIGGKKYTQEELQGIIGFKTQVEELETKFNTKLDRLMPEFTKKTQRLAEIEPEWEQLKKAKDEEANKPRPSTLTPEEKEQAKKALIDILGDDVVKRQDFDAFYAQRRSAEKLVEDIDTLIVKNKEDGKPSTNREDLLKHMSETGIRNPERAYKDMFDEQLDKWKEDQLKKVKPSGMFTQSNSDAGNKQPNPLKVTKDNLASMIAEVVNRG
jgi:hypothetical protein